jgi:pimeloyl-ACP methyl ester carboxylesterase
MENSATPIKRAVLPQRAVSYRETGSGEPIVFVHGFLVNSRLWDPVVERLHGEFRCIQPDLPLGSHRTPMNADADLTPPGIARLLVDFLDSVGLDRVTIVGNDSGGAISQLLATAHPERVARLILTNCDLYEDFPPKLFAYFHVVARVPGALNLLAQSMRIKPLRRTPIAFGLLTKGRLDESLLDDWVEPVASSAEIRRDATKFMRGTSGKLTVRAAHELADFPSPTLFAWAPEDRLFKIKLAERLAATMPDARIVRIPDSKTFISLDQPDRLAQEIAGFMRETQPAAAASA